MDPDWAGKEFKKATALDCRTRGTVADLVERLVTYSEKPFSVAAGEAGRQVFWRLGRRTLPSAEPVGPPEAGCLPLPEAEGATPAVAAGGETGQRLGPAQLLAGHFYQTAQRSQEYPLVLVAQDTTELHFPHTTIPCEAGGLGPTGTERNKRGLFAHSALALSPDGLPLGLLHLALWSRDPAAHGQGAQRRSREVAEKESQRWLDGVAAVEATLPVEQPVVVIQDREGDIFALLSQPRRAQTFLLVRAAQDRKVEWQSAPGRSERSRLFTVAAAGSLVGNLTVRVPRRQGQDEAQATLEIRVSRMEVQPPSRLTVAERKRLDAAPVAVTVIRAHEPAPPRGAPAIEWVLVTTLPVETAADAVQVVGYYALRWRIERLHFVLKSGTKVEQSQQQSRAALERALALYYLVAWRLLWLTYLARIAPELPATVVFTHAEIRILARGSRKPVKTIASAVRALAILGGYVPYRSALPPGVKVLWRGSLELRAALFGYETRDEELCEQAHSRQR